MIHRQKTLLLALAVLLVALAVVWGTRRGSREAAASGAAGQGGRQAAGEVRPDRPERTRETRPGRGGGGAPSSGGSEAVAALVGNAAMSDAEVLAGLQRMVEDAGRPLTERLEALDHVINLVPGNDPSVLRELAARRVLPDEVRLRLVAESLNLKPHLQGELLVSLLENAAGDARGEVLAQLKGLCGEDLGDDPAAWRAAIDRMPADP